MTMLVQSHNDLDDLVENDVERPNDNDFVEKIWPKQTWSIDQLEAALKQRIGWVDEAISPFARRIQPAHRTAEKAETR